MATSKHTKVSGIYIILNTKNGKVYIGQTVDFHGRWKHHKTELNTGCHFNSHLQRAWGKYGAKAFKFHKLEYCSVDQLDEREQHYLNIYMAKGLCYNIAKDPTAPMRGRQMSEETRQRMSESNKRRPPFTEDRRRKISEALRGHTRNKGRKASEETRRKISEAAKRRDPATRKHSEETKRKIGEKSKGNKSNLGRKHSEETKRKMSASMTGIKKGPLSEERRRQISESLIGNKSQLGKHPSEETRRKMSESQKRRQSRLQTKQENEDNLED